MSGAAAQDKKQFSLFLKNNYGALSESAVKRLEAYGDMLAEATQRMGLVARGDAKRIFVRHIQEALAPQLVGYLPDGKRVIDVGSGGGLPGIPLAIVRDDLVMTLVEPRHRKAAFLEKTVLSLGLSVEVMTASVDAVARRHPERRWDVVVSRGLKWTRPMVKVLGDILEPDGALLRFGDPAFRAEGVEVSRLEGDEPRAIQRWPREAWSELPEAR